jgi:DNA-binding NarL/FixJ family response regulator
MSTVSSQLADVAARDCFARLLPDVHRRVRLAFRHLPPEAREEAVQEALAHAYLSVVLLAHKRRLDLAFGSVLAGYAVARVRSGRRFTGGDERSDVLSRTAQRRYGFGVSRIDRRASDGESWREAVVEDHSTPVPDQVAFRLDFPRWLATHTPRDRAIARQLADGERTTDVAERFGLSMGRISQLRRQFADSWERFHEPREAAAA